MKIQVIFLGTGQAIPTAKRNHTSILIKYKSENLLFDCGEGTQRQFRKAKQSLSKITRLLITHWHGDHVLGIPGLLQTLQLSKYGKSLRVYGPKGTKQFMSLMKQLFIKHDRLKLEVKDISKGKVLETADFVVEALPMKHQSPCLAYCFKEKDKTRIDKRKLRKQKKIPGKLIGKLARGKNIKWKGKIIKAKQVTYKQKGKKISIIMDTSPNSNTIKIAKNSGLLITEGVYGEKEKKLAKEYKHLTVSQAANIAKKAKVKRLILAHISQRYDKNTKKLLNEAKKVFKKVKIAEDFDKIEI